MLSPAGPARPALLALRVGGDVAAWRRCGFSVGEGGLLRAGEVVIALDNSAGEGVTGWHTVPAVEGLPRFSCPDTGEIAAVHDNAVTGVDHVVITTPDINATTGALVAAGCELRRERTARIGGADVIQRFLPMTGALAELVTAVPPAGDAAGLWGITFACRDMSALPAVAGRPRPAVQPGRQIAVATAAAGLGAHVAFITER